MIVRTYVHWAIDLRTTFEFGITCDTSCLIDLVHAL